MTSMNLNHSEIELCNLFGQMNLEKQESYAAQPEAILVDDISCDSDASSDTGFKALAEFKHNGCAYLQALQMQLDNYPTTGGEYLEAIFTHREILCAYPVAHQLCAQGFSDIAYALEQRAWRADREADTEAIVAFRHEAWMIASTLIYQPASSPPDSFKEFTVICSQDTA